LLDTFKCKVLSLDQDFRGVTHEVLG
jgi:hypothetical protein